MKYFIKTFGCAMNHSDSERVSAFIEKRGLQQAEKIEQADLVVFNTCGIRQAAENRAYGFINNLKKDNPSVKIVLTGCLANRNDVQKRMKNKVDLFCEIKNFPKDVSCILYSACSMDSDPKIRNTRYEIRDTKNPLTKEDIDYLAINPKHTNPYEALVPVMTGCNNFCSYCVVPYARGREVSRQADDVLTEVLTLVRTGCKMITLLGQNVNSYHGTWDMEHGAKVMDHDALNTKQKIISFSTLLKKINAIPGKFWITFVSSHPKDMDDELIETIAKCKKACEWIHLPIQAGDDEILRRMNRKYTQEHYLKRIRKIKSAFKKYKPGEPFSVSTDIIVGFPGETKKQFLQSATVMEKARFDMAYFGQFSPRPGTAAWKMKDTVSKEEKSRRENALNEILKKTALANNRKYVGMKIEVLIEKEKGGAYYGRTRTMKNVKIKTDKKIPLGTFAKVKITKANIWNLEGII